MSSSPLHACMHACMHEMVSAHCLPMSHAGMLAQVSCSQSCLKLQAEDSSEEVARTLAQVPADCVGNADKLSQAAKEQYTQGKLPLAMALWRLAAHALTPPVHDDKSTIAAALCGRACARPIVRADCLVIKFLLVLASTASA